MPDVADRQAAISDGIMFEDPKRTIAHDELVQILTTLVSQIDASTIAQAFISSLESRRLDLRSALGSYAVGRLLPDHRFEPGRNVGCRICGLSRKPKSINLNVLNFERFKWGGVRRADISYVAFDLLQFGLAPKETCSQRHVEIGREMLGILKSLPSQTTATSAASALRMVKGNSQERESLIDILGVCGILETHDHRGYANEFVPYDSRQLPTRHYVERAYPVCWWKAADGINSDNLRRILPQIEA